MIVDFRSDTVTRPTQAMLQAMTSAPLGDDVFGDDPTVNELQRKVASMFGKEAALFCPSGTMTNQIAIKVHTQPGDEVVCDQLAHIYQYEGGGIAFNSGCSVRLLAGDRGRYTADMVLDAINPNDPHYAQTSLVSIENTCNKGGGAVWDLAQINEISKVCKERGLKLHLDGARVFNAMQRTGTDPISMGMPFDSLSICFSKGLGCPVGSVLLGSAEFIERAKRIRKVFGGGMRQAGVLAAAAIYALDHHVQRLNVDHDHASLLAVELKKCSWVKEIMPVETNIVVAELSDVTSQSMIISTLKDLGILVVAFGSGKIRFVTHIDTTSEMIDYAISMLPRIEKS